MLKPIEGQFGTGSWVSWKNHPRLACTRNSQSYYECWREIGRSNPRWRKLATTTTTIPFNGPCPGLPGWAGTRKVKPIWILLEQETVSGSGISWAICKSAPGSRQITTPAPHHSVFYRPDTLPAAQPTASKHWRPNSRQQRNRSWCSLGAGMGPRKFRVIMMGLWIPSNWI